MGDCGMQTEAGRNRFKRQKDEVLFLIPWITSPGVAMETIQRVSKMKKQR